MNSTTFLAQVWGPAVLAVGLGIFISRNYYIKIYKDLDKNTLAVLLFGIVMIVVGIIQVGMHNVWGSLSEVVLSLIGWGTLVKGFAFTIVPNLVAKAGDWEVHSGLVPAAGALTLIVGIYLTWVGYFM